MGGGKWGRRYQLARPFLAAAFFDQGGLGEQPRARLAIGFGLAVHGVEDPFEQRDVDTLGFDPQRRRINRNQRPGATLELRVALKVFNGSGRGRLPSSIRPSRCSSIASRVIASASSIVLPAEKQPGRSGTVTP